MNSNSCKSLQFGIIVKVMHPGLKFVKVSQFPDMGVRVRVFFRNPHLRCSYISLTLYCMNYFAIPAEITCYQLITLCNRGSNSHKILTIKPKSTFYISKYWKFHIYGNFPNKEGGITQKNQKFHFQIMEKISQILLLKTFAFALLCALQSSFRAFACRTHFCA